MSGKSGGPARSHVTVGISGPTIVPCRASVSYLSATGFLLNGVDGLRRDDVLYVKFSDGNVVLCSVARVKGATARVKITRSASSQPLIRLLETDHELYSGEKARRGRESENIDAAGPIT